MTKLEKQWWEQERARGYSYYLLRRGIVGRGLYFGFFMTAFCIAVPYFTHHPIPSVLELTAKFGVCTLGFGALVGSRNWRENETDYQKPTEDDDTVA